MEPDVEALLVNRLGAARGFPVNQYFLLPDRPVLQAGGPGAHALARALRRRTSCGAELERYFAALTARAGVGAEAHRA